MWCVLEVLIVEVLTVLILNAVDKVWNQCGDATCKCWFIHIIDQTVILWFS